MKRFLLFLLLLIQVGILNAQDGSVVCLHGFFRSYKCMIPLGNTLRKEGFNVYLWDYQSRKKTIEKHADDLVVLLQAIAAEKPGEPIHFVCHSLGGIIVRCVMNHPHCPDEAKIGKAILLAPPNQGACIATHFRKCPLANWILGKRAGSQLLHANPEDFANIGTFPPSKEVLVIAGSKGTRLYRLWERGPNDGKLKVEETYLSTPHHHKTLDVGHSWIMTSRESIQLTRDFILDRPREIYAVGRSHYGAPVESSPATGRYPHNFSQHPHY